MPRSTRVLAHLLPMMLVTSPGWTQDWTLVGATPHAGYSALVLAADGGLFSGGNGLWRSPDGGQNWSYIKADTLTVSVSPDYRPFIFDISARPDGRMLLSFLQPAGALVTSADNGATWSYCAPSGSGALPVSVDIAPDGTFYALWSLVGDPIGDNGIFRSNDHGAHWVRTALSAEVAQYLGDILAGPDGTLYAIEGANKPSGPWQLYRSSDGGDNWSIFDIGHRPFAGYPMGRAIWADALGHVVIGCHDGIARSTDGGVSWDFWAGDPVAYGGVVRNSRGVLFAGYSGPANGVVLSADLGQTWHDFSSGLEVQGSNIQYRALAVDAQDNVYVANTNRNVYRSELASVAVMEPERRTPELRLDAIAPNPTSGGALVRLIAPNGEAIVLEVFDLAGRMLQRRSDAVGIGGTHTVRLDTKNWRAGVYLVRVRAGGRSVTGACVVAR